MVNTGPDPPETRQSKLAFAMRLQLLPLDYTTTICLHLLDDQCSAKDERRLEELIVEDRFVGAATTARRQAGGIAISASITIETIRGQRIFVVDVYAEAGAGIEAHPSPRVEPKERQTTTGHLTSRDQLPSSRRHARTIPVLLVRSRLLEDTRGKQSVDRTE